MSSAGEVPHDWSLSRLCEAAEVRYGLGQPPEPDENGVRMIRATNVKRGSISAEGLIRVKRAAWAKRIDVKPRELHIRQMRRKWGGCSTEGRVTLNQDLLSASADLRREVIVEELLHLRVPNHGKLFRALKRAFLA